MAKAPEKTEAAAEKPGKKRLILIIGLVLVLLVGAGGAAFFVMKKNHQQATEGDEEAPAKRKAKPKPEHPPAIVKLDQFTVKLRSDEGKNEQYMQAVVELEARDPSVADLTKGYMSQIRAKILLILMGKTPSEISSPEGVETLSVELRNAVNQILDGNPRAPDATKTAADDPVQAVYLTQFIIQ